MLTLARIASCRALHAACVCQTRTSVSNINGETKTKSKIQLQGNIPQCRSIHSLINNRLWNLCDGHKLDAVQKLHTSAIPANKKVDKSRVPVLKENDLEEGFVRGSGPGGQSVARTSSACHLKHIPTNLVVKCHEQRSLFMNRKKARLLLIEKLDHLYNGDMSVAAQLKRLQEEKSNKAQQKFKKRQTMKQMWKEREGID